MNLLRLLAMSKKYGDMLFASDSIFQPGKITQGGTALTDTILCINNHVYVCDAEGNSSILANSWYTDANGNKYYTTSLGEFNTNRVVKTIEGVYYFGADGIMKTDYLHYAREGIMYFGADGKMGTEYVSNINCGIDSDGAPILKDGYFVMNTNGMAYLTAPEDGTIDGVLYEFDEEGFIIGKGLDPNQKFTVTIYVYDVDENEIELTFSEVVGNTFTYIPEEIACQGFDIYDADMNDVDVIEATEESTYYVIYFVEHELVSRAEIPPTCDAEGRTAGKMCLNCDYNTFEVIPPIGHKWNEGTVEGNKVIYKCTVCGETKTEDIVS